MIGKALRWLGLLGAALAFGLGAWLYLGFTTPANVPAPTVFVIQKGASLTSVAQQLEQAALIDSARAFLLRARFFGGGEAVRAGEYEIKTGASEAELLELFQSGKVLLHQVTFPEGVPAVRVVDLLNAETVLTGSVDTPVEGTILPDTYTFTRGESRAAVLARAEAAMTAALAKAWESRAANLPLQSPAEALTLASIVEKETSKPSEYRRVAGVYINRLRVGMKLQADPTVIYPVTKGRPLGRRIRQSELDAVNDYNTYAMAGLPKGPIAMPGRAALEATLNPETHDYLFFVADGSGGHVFAKTYAEHNRNVVKWRQFRAEKGI
jgi:UPF0755 protein